LAAVLAVLGWQRAETLDWGNALRFLSPSLPLGDLPLIPQVVQGRQEALALVRPGPEGSRHVLRLWPTRFRLADGPSLWVGTVSSLRKRSILDLAAFPVTDSPLGGLTVMEQAELQVANDRLPVGQRLLLLPPVPSASTGGEPHSGQAPVTGGP
jgi:LssY C-terminus